MIGNYSLQKAIGEGTFGKVHLGVHLITGEKVAIKILEKEKIKDADSLERVRREICFLKSLRHESIIQLYEIIESNTSIYLIMEFAEGGELFNYIVKKQRLNDLEASFFFCQIINTIEIIHKYKIAHRDLKPENLLLSDNKLLKLIDFGLSNNYNSSNPLLKTPCGSPCYAAPEMLQGKLYNGLQIDIWSTGIILYAMVNGFLPFEDDNNTQLYKKILECKLYFPFPLSTTVLDMIHKILNTNPEKRITLDEIKEHEFYLMGLKSLLRKEIQVDKQRLLSITIEKMKNFGFKKSEVLDNLADNNHNKITATFYILFNKLKSEYYLKNSKHSIPSISSLKPLITINDSPRKKTEIIFEPEEEVYKKKVSNDDKYLDKNSDKTSTISNGKKSYNTSKNNSKKKISFSIDQSKLPLKSKIIIFKKKNTINKTETPELYLKTEATNIKDVCNTEYNNKDIMLTETQDKSATHTTFSYKKLSTLNNNINLKTNYLSTEVRPVISSKRKENSIQEYISPSSKNINSKNTPQKETSYKSYINQNLYPLSIQNGSKMFTKIKINPNIQFLLKDFKRKVENNSANKDRDLHHNLNYVMQTETIEHSKNLGKKIINYKENIKNHSVSNPNKISDYSHLQAKPNSSLSKDKRLMENPMLNILQTETNNISSFKINSFNKSNVNNVSDRLTTLSTFYSKKIIENKAHSPKIQKLLSSDKTNSFNYKIINQKVASTTKENKEILFNKHETFFYIEDIKNIKEKIFNFCKRNLLNIIETDINRIECFKDNHRFAIEINKLDNTSSLKVVHINGKKEITNDIVKRFLCILEKGN